MASLGKSELVKLFNGAGNYILWMLRVILVYAGQALFDEVSAAVKPTNSTLCGAAYNADLACKTDKFIYLRGRVTRREDQEQVVRDSVVVLIRANKTEHLDSLAGILAIVLLEIAFKYHFGW